MIDFKTLGDVPVVDEIQDTDTVLVARDGEIYRADMSKVGGGAGGYLLVPGAGEVEIAERGGSLFVLISTPISKLKDVIKAGGVATILLDLGMVSDGSTTGNLYSRILEFNDDSPDLLAEMAATLEMTAVDGYGCAMFTGSIAYVVFTNGGPLPAVTDNASATSLTTEGSTSPLAALRAKLGGGAK